MSTSLDLPDAELNVKLQRCIDVLTEHRQTHVEWRDYLRRYPDYDPGEIGDADFHNETVQHYNFVLGVLTALLEVEATNG